MYSLDFRRRVISRYKKGDLQVLETCALFGITHQTFHRWLTQGIEVKSPRKPKKTKIDMAALAIDVEKYPDAYQYERAKRLNVSANCVMYALRRLGISRKKKFSSSKTR